MPTAPGPPLKYRPVGDMVDEGEVMEIWLSWHALVGEDTMNSEADMPMEDPSSGGVRPAWITELLSSANRNPKLPRILDGGCKLNEKYFLNT